MDKIEKQFMRKISWLIKLRLLPNRRSGAPYQTLQLSAVAWRAIQFPDNPLISSSVCRVHCARCWSGRIRRADNNDREMSRCVIVGQLLFSSNHRHSSTCGWLFYMCTGVIL